MAKKEAEDLFGLIEKFAGYGFNKSHSTAYALIAYMTAYLKAHYSVEFMAALLSSDIPGRNFKRKDSLVEHLEDCQRMNVSVLPPDVNQSGAEFTVLDGKICFGLSAIKGCGGAASAAIAKERAAHGPYRSLFDFCERLDPGTVNRTAIESLIKAGAFHALGAKRAQLFAAIDRALQAGASAASDRRSGQLGLFGGDEEDQPSAAGATNLPDLSEWSERDRLAKEKEVLGFYLSSNPLTEHEKTFAAYCSHTTAQAAELNHRTEAVLGGMISAIKLSNTKNPKPGSPSRFAMFDLEDTDGIMRCIVWPDQFVHYEHLIQADAIVVVRGGAILEEPAAAVPLERVAWLLSPPTSDRKSVV
jgi:DNA polymerase-3 subunit alpha